MNFFQKYLREIVYGGIDGSITTFAVVSGAVGAGMDTSVIIILGFANLFADGLSMSVGAYLSSKSEKKLFEKYRSSEIQQINDNPLEEREEVRNIYKAKGFEGKQLEEVVDVICANQEVWVEEMMKNEHELIKEPKSSFNIGLATFVAFFIMGFIPLSFYLLDFFVDLNINLFLSTAVFTGISFVIIGVFKSNVTKESFVKSIFETLGLGVAAASVAYLVGYFLDLYII